MQNLKDSIIRWMVDDWYEANVQGKPKETLLEDTVWCSDRSVISEKYTIESYANGTSAVLNLQQPQESLVVIVLQKYH